MTPLLGKIALVTGGSRGIGKAVARRLAADGALVAVHYGSNTIAATHTVREIVADGGRAFPVRAELGVPGDVECLFAALTAGLREHTDGEPALDILVNNAAIGDSGALETETPESFDRVFAVNVRAPFFIIQRALPLLRDHGRIINISSAVTRIALPEITYAMSKGALETLGRTLANQVGDRGITVNTVAPGPTETDRIAAWLRGDPNIAALIAGGQAIPRVGQPTDIADPVAFLASEPARWITGQTLDTSGGSFLGPRHP
ncbi:SDR family oxidoreductase [Embleya sp. NBC_00888]|uniref:SDR family oxidoreductase n=1 Tax=Embleya sp. NBC_00888 TaxID=2975960 RepID=UPI003868E434|nr:SDR family oxidoreductase [Embleya sp. NBC_00888]